MTDTPRRLRFALLVFPLLAAGAATAGELKFKEQTVDPAVGVCYALTVADINGDGKPDIVVVTEQPDQVVWYENPSWKRRVIVEKTPKLPVCIQPVEIAGKTHLFLGADWIPTNTKDGGSVWLLKRPDGDDLDKPWTPVALDAEPTMHRMRVVEIDGKKELLCSPLQGRDTKPTDWTSGAGAVQYVLKRPADPFKDKWTREVVTAEMHTVHNLWPTDWDGDGKPQVVIAGSEGLLLVKRGDDGKWAPRKLADGSPTPGAGKAKGAGEVKSGRLPGGGKYLITIEPWHGPAAVVHTFAKPDAAGVRTVLIEGHKGGHALWTADFTGAGYDSAVVGFRGIPEGKKEECAVYILTPPAAPGGAWAKFDLDIGGMGCEDVTVADLNGDGKPDIIAAGRSTKNVKIYWNESASAPAPAGPAK